MLKNVLAIIALTGLGLVGCAVAPSPSQLDNLPLVTIGDEPPPGEEFVFYLPANEAIPANVAIEGNLLSEPATEKLRVNLNKDIYVYKDWVSYDKQNWHPAREVLDIQAEIMLPGPKHPKPARIYLKVDEKRQ